MNDLVGKLILLERLMASEQGDFSLFALFLREDAPDKWDLVVSAPWIEVDKRRALDFIARQLRSHLEPEELLSLSKVVLIDHDDPALGAIHNAVRVLHGTMEIRNSAFFGLSIRHAYIITSQKPSEPVATSAG
jgi:hypothetical protein